MKLKKLRELLATFPPELDNAEVVMTCDAEGNSYSPLSDLSSDAAYTPENPWSGKVFYRDHGVEGNCLDSEDQLEQLLKEYPAIVLRPVN